MTSNNEYFKRIYETLSNRSVTGNHNDNYYLKQISLCLGNSYTGNKCNGKYLKDIAEQVTGKSYNNIHFRNYFLREIVMTVYQGTLTNNTDNYYLRLWSENCDSDSLVSSITLSCSANNIDIDRTFSLSGSLSVGAGKTVKIYENDVLLATVTTEVNGVFRLSDLYKSSTGVFTYQAKYEGDDTYSRSSSERITVRVVKRNAVLSMSVQDDSVIYGEDIVLNGTLKYNGSNISDASVKIYKGNTLIDTISASTGTFRKTISGVSVGTHDFHAVFENTKYNTISTSNIIVTVSLKPTSLSINVPANLVYTDNFDITGVLTDGTNPISNANVDLLVGATVVDTATTNSNGQVEFTRTPVTMGTHTFQLSYAGDSSYSESSSSVINKEINKETSVLTVNSPSTSNYTMFEGQLAISGTLKTDDNEPIVGTILVKEGNSTLTTLSSNSNGSFNGNVSLTEGTHNLEIVYNATSYYTASSVSKTIVVKAPSLSLDTDMSILSSIDDEYCVLSATLDDLNKSNKTVTFEVRKQSDDSLVESLTAKTNASGVATVSYYGKGTGGLYIQASTNNIISNSVTIEDYYWMPKLDGTESKRQITGSTTISDGVMSGGSSYLTEHYIDNTKDWEVALEGKISGSAGGIVFVKAGTTQRDKDRFMFVRVENTSRNYAGWLLAQTGQSTLKDNLTIVYPSNDTYASFVFKKQGDTYSVTVDDMYTMSITSTNFSSVTELGIGVDTWGSTASIKNIKVKYI